jgi:hypothetical protein
MNHRYRFSKKLSVNYSLYLSPQNNNVGYVGRMGTDIIFGMRDIQNVENSLNIKYSFNDKMNINIRVRHYWIRGEYHKYFLLLQDGHLQEINTYPGNADFNVNFFNVDAGYSWQFARAVLLPWYGKTRLKII